MSDASILERLSSFIDRRSPSMAAFLYRMWSDQQQAVTYRELRDAILDGSLNASYLLDWQQDYSRFLRESYAPVVEQAVQRAAAAMAQEYGEGVSAPMTGAMDAFIQNHGGRLIRETSEDQYRAINALVRQAALTDTLTVDQLARAIRPCIGLTSRQCAQAMRFYQQLREQGVPHKGALSRQITYAAKLHRRRAALIAQTETAYAYNAGYFESVGQQIGTGALPAQTKKMWVTAEDERVCPQCGALNGEMVPFAENFSSGVAYPPAHPGCRCAFKLVFPQSPQYESGGQDRHEFIRSLNQEQREAVLGGKGKRALFDAGLLEGEDIAAPLKELKARGIMVPGERAIRHSALGDYQQPSQRYPVGRLSGGCHCQSGMELLDAKGIEYHVVKTLDNGVRLGYVLNHKVKDKANPQKLRQAWFPKAWTAEDIRTAGCYVANRGMPAPGAEAYGKEAVWNNVRVRCLFDQNGITTICPSYDE